VKDCWLRRRGGRPAAVAGIVEGDLLVAAGTGARLDRGVARRAGQRRRDVVADGRRGNDERTVEIIFTA
jgi:hypothetical protein